MLINRYRIKIILLYLWGFYFFFMPDLEPFIPFYKNLYVLIILDCIIICKYRLDILTFLKKSKTLLPIVLLIGSSIYTLFVTVFNSYNLVNNLTAIIVPLKLVCFIGLMMTLSEILLTTKQKLDYLINIGVIQGIICILMLLFQPLKQIANSLYIYNIPDYFESSLLGITSSRIYGITGDYTYSTPIFMALIASTALIMFFYKKEKKYLIFSFVNILGSTLNGRTGLFLYMICTLIAIIVYFERKKVTKKKVIGFIGCCLLLTLLLILLRDTPWFHWFKNSFNEVISMFKGEKVGTVAVLSSFIFFPSGLSFIFGVGSRVYGDFGLALVNKVSDIGYINDIFRGGILYVGVYYFSICKLFLVTYQESKHKLGQKFTAIMLLITGIFLIFSNYKGEALAGSSIFFCFMFVVYAMINTPSISILKNEKMEKSEVKDE